MAIALSLGVARYVTRKVLRSLDIGVLGHRHLRRNAVAVRAAAAVVLDPHHVHPGSVAVRVEDRDREIGLEDVVVAPAARVGEGLKNRITAVGLRGSRHVDRPGLGGVGHIASGHRGTARTGGLRSGRTRARARARHCVRPACHARRGGEADDGESAESSDVQMRSHAAVSASPASELCADAIAHEFVRDIGCLPTVDRRSGQQDV